MRFEYEELPSGITAVFGHRPHYQTTSTRLVFKAGNLHEDPNAPPGVAHFLEHTPFQGTEEFPSRRAVNEYIEQDGSRYNAYTGPVTTAYVIDQGSLDRATNTVFQLGFHPLLKSKGLDADRNAVIEEAREMQYDPYWPEIRDYYQRFGGKKYAQLIQGNISDVKKINEGHINDYYRRHYQPGNAFLVVCSSASIAKQRKIANQLAEKIDTDRTMHNPKPVRLDLPWLIPDQSVASFHNKKDEKEAQSGISVAYNLEVPRSLAEFVLLEAAVDLVDRAIFDKIREKKNLAYEASAALTAVENVNHDISEDYYALEVHTRMAGKSVVKALNAIDFVEEGVKHDTKHAEATLLSKRRKLQEALQSGPAETADNITDSAQVYFDKVYEPAKELEIVKDLTTREVKDKAALILTDRRLIGIAGPNKQLIKGATKYAAKKLG